MRCYKHGDLEIQSADSNCQYSDLEKQRKMTTSSQNVQSQYSQPQAVAASYKIEKTPRRRTTEPSKKQLLDYINQVSLATYDTLLFLDTHKYDQEAMKYFSKYFKLKEAAMKEYARLYGPLTTAHMTDSSSNAWEWVMQPWPWEGGSR